MGIIQSVWNFILNIVFSSTTIIVVMALVFLFGYRRINHLEEQLVAVREGVCKACGAEQGCPGCGALDPFGLVGEEAARRLWEQSNAPRPAAGLLRSDFKEYVRQYEAIHEVKTNRLERLGIRLGIERNFKGEYSPENRGWYFAPPEESDSGA